MDYGFELSFETTGKITPGRGWITGEQLAGGLSHVVPTTPRLETHPVSFTVFSEEIITPSDACAIGLSVMEGHFPTANPHEVIFRRLEDPLAAAPGETRVCLFCGHINGGHGEQCALD
jgi:hypothetical protein